MEITGSAAAALGTVPRSAPLLRPPASAAGRMRPGGPGPLKRSLRCSII